MATRILIAHPLAPGGAPGVWLGYIGVWVPLVAAVVIAAGGRLTSLASRGSFASNLLPDVALGLGAGLLARAIDALLTVAVTGSTGLAPQPTLGGGPTGALAAAVILAPVVVAPVIEELFFRGVLQGAVARALAGPAHTAAGAGSAATPDRFAVWTAAALVAVVFAVVHVLVAPSAPIVLTVGGTFVLGIAAGAVVVRTGRLGGAIVAHVVFNGVAVLLTWPR
ncbi:hypothetical protein AX769_10260 [Frondihabitans sp. PAMC 28766]|nr:hypothetical protein AX769_10260 [Frondihabitans sp. PAMC 28766]